jgi:hypothetical protein
VHPTTQHQHRKPGLGAPTTEATRIAALDLAGIKAW